MKLLETYALASGSKIDKPFIFEQYFPLGVEKYITIQGQTKFDSKDYSYWQDVINALFPILDKYGIKIIQVGGPKETQFQYVIDLRGRTDPNQLAYIMKNSMLHLGSDSLCAHIASHYDIPMVALYSVSQSSVSGPHFGTKDKQVCFDAYLRTRTGKPSYASQESPKCVDLIMPEEIIDAALKLLNLQERASFKTVFIGQKYIGKIIREFVPTKAVNIPNPEIPVEIRMDIHFDENVLAQQLAISKGIVITNKRINKAILSQFKQRIPLLVYLITEQDEPQFILDIKDIGIPIVLLTSLSKEEYQSKKLTYYEHGKINETERVPVEKINELKADIDNLYFRSNKLVTDGEKVYMGETCRVIQEELQNDFTYHKATDIPAFWKDLPFMTVVKKI